MGHTQCISQIPETNAETQRIQAWRTVPDSLRHHKLRSSDVPMILPNLIPEKSLTPVQLKDQSLELRKGESTEDAPQVERALAHLRESGWYWGPISATQAKQLLSEAQEGTFLLRDSSNPSYLLTLSVKTSLGPTHLRIETSGDTFGFDSLAMARPRLRRFSGAVQLVEHYTLACHQSARPQDQPKLTEGTPDKSLQLKLIRPLHKAAPSLQHLCRITINQHSNNLQDLPLPGRLKAFLQEYPFLL
ncbi:hypothetical protein AAFF_G00029840 [Aldrovandia affinis]|uniref:Suppressor of cytokine signaling 2 n=1 Tax=Aldrovandia affinis TaxID=143900 RepID=A0AAD7S4E5_9TELE|nr:hypothetical protein AAFF_G00029840 [Aldrovandia affinis]